MLLTDDGDSYKILDTFLANLITNILYLFTLASSTNIQMMSPTSKFGHHHRQFVTNFKSQR